MPHRRSFLSIIAAPFIIRDPKILMPVRGIVMPVEPEPIVPPNFLDMLGKQIEGMGHSVRWIPMA